MVTAAPISEADFQRQVVELARRLGWMTCHTYRTRTAKGAWRTSTTAVGYPDLTLLHPGKRRLVFLELKTDKGKPTAEQLAWIVGLQSVPGVEAYIVHPAEWDDVVDVLTHPPAT